MGYQKEWSYQHSLIAMFENWKKNLDKCGKYGALFLECYISSFRSNRKYLTKIDSSFGKWKHLFIDVTQGSVLGF